MRAWVPTVLVAGALYGVCAVRVPFWDKGEAREALVVQAVVRAQGLDTFVLPRRAGTEIASKPPLFHWLAAIAVTAGLRPEELAMRAPSIALGAAAVALTAGLATRWYGLPTGILAALVVGSSFEWLRAATTARVDMTLTFLILAAVLAWNAGLAAGGRRALVRLGWALAAGAVVTKGPVGIVLPLLAVTTGALAAGEGARLRRLLDAPGLLAAAAVCGAWYGLAWHSGGADFVRRQILHENLQRFLGPVGGAGHRHGLLFYVPALAGGFLPWTLVLPPALRDAWRSRDPRARFLLGWAAAVFAFYSLAAGKRSVYLLPLFPPLAILGAHRLARFVAEPTGRATRVVLAAAALAAVAAGALVVAHAEGPLAGTAVGFLHGSDRARLPLALAIVERGRWGIAAALGVAAGCLLALERRTARPVRLRMGAIAGLAVVWSLALSLLGTYPLARELTPRGFAARVRAVVGAEDALWARGTISYAFRYYLGRPLRAWKEHGTHAPRAWREFALGPAALDDAGLRRRGLRTRFIDTEPRVDGEILELDEVRDTEG